jgi:hypothetical protein
MPDNATLDPSRLVHLARVRDQRRAVAKDHYNKYQETREKRVATQRLLDAAAASHDLNEFPKFREESAATVAQLTAQVAELSATMTKLYDDGEAASAEANEAATLFARCLAFAIDAGLEIPPSLKSEADALRARSGAPMVVV